MTCLPKKIVSYLLLVVLTLFMPCELAVKDCQAGSTGDKVSYRVTGDVYFGDKNLFSAPAILVRDKVFAKIPAFKKIKKEKLEKNSARYFLLLEKANEVFREKVKETAEELGYDLVVEKGGIKAEPEQKFTNITQDVIESI